MPFFWQPDIFGGNIILLCYTCILNIIIESKNLARNT